MPLKEYVDELAAIGDKESLDYAISLSQNISSWLVKLMARRARLGENVPAASVVSLK